MRVRLADKTKMDSLVAYLERCECRISFLDGELDVRPRELPVDPRLRHEELELSAFLRVWSMLNPRAGVELVSTSAGRRASAPESGVRAR